MPRGTRRRIRSRSRAPRCLALVVPLEQALQLMIVLLVLLVLARAKHRAKETEGVERGGQAIGSRDALSKCQLRASRGKVAGTTRTKTALPTQTMLPRLVMPSNPLSPPFPHLSARAMPLYSWLVTSDGLPSLLLMASCEGL